MKQEFFSKKDLGGIKDEELLEELQRVNEANRKKNELLEKETKQYEDSSVMPTIDYVRERIKDAVANELVVEVLIFSLRAMKLNPMITIGEAVNRGCEEWDV